MSSDEQTNNMRQQLQQNSSPGHLPSKRSSVGGHILKSLDKSPQPKPFGSMIAGKRPQPMPIRNEATGIDRGRRVLYRNFHQVAEVVYLVEISKNDKKMFICLFPNFEKPAIMISQILSEKIGQKLLTDNLGIFENWISTFSIRFGKLWNEGYHGNGTDPRKARTVAPNHLEFYAPYSKKLKDMHGYGDELKP